MTQAILLSPFEPFISADKVLPTKFPQLYSFANNADTTASGAADAHVGLHKLHLPPVASESEVTPRGCLLSLFPILLCAELDI